MGYWRRKLSYLKRIVLFDPTHVMSMADLVAISVETPKIDSGWSLGIIGYDMKSLGMIVWSRWDCPPQYLRTLTQEMRCSEILGQGSENIGEGVPDDFLMH